MAKQRIDKIIASQNIASRSEVKTMIKQRRIMADGKPVTAPEEKFDAETTVITVDGKDICFKKYLYIMMNKPSGVLSASNDRHARTVTDLLPPHLQRDGLFPAGRLDKDTEGFILITDDGELAHKMLSPKSHVYKLYQAEVDRELNETDIQTFSQGIVCGDVRFLPADMKIIHPRTALVEICEGKFHQVKKMFQAVGANVVHLKRLRIGMVFLDETLASGECRELHKEEISALLSKMHGI